MLVRSQAGASRGTLRPNGAKADRPPGSRARVKAVLTVALAALSACRPSAAGSRASDTDARAGEVSVAATALPASDVAADRGVEASAPPATTGATEAPGSPSPPLPALPLDHLARVARHRGFGRVFGVGTRTVLVDCHRIAVLASHATHIVRLGPRAGSDDECIEPLGSDETRLFFGEGDDTVTAFDAVSGRIVWSAHEPGPHDPHLELMDGGTIAGAVIALRERDGTLVAFERSSGQIVWRTTRPDGLPTVSFPVVAAAGRVVAAARTDGVLRARDAATGAVVWQTPLAIDGEHAEALEGSLVADGGTIALLVSASYEGGAPVTSVLLVDASTGVVRARSRVADLGAVRSTLTFAGGGLYARNDDMLLRLARDTGALLWKAPGAFSEPVVDGDAVFVGDDKVRLVALDPASGVVRWTYGVARKDSPVSTEVQPRWVRDPDHADATVLAVGARSGPETTHDEVSFFARGPSAHPERTVSVTGVYLAVPPPEPPSPEVIPEALFIGATKVPLQRDGTFRATVTGRGVQLVAEEHSSTALQAIDLDEPRGAYRLVLHAPGYDQTCR